MSAVREIVARRMGPALRLDRPDLLFRHGRIDIRKNGTKIRRGEELPHGTERSQFAGVIGVDEVQAVIVDRRSPEIEERDVETFEPIPGLFAFEFAPYAGIVPIRFIVIQVVNADADERKLHADELDAALLGQRGHANDRRLLSFGHVRSTRHGVYEHIRGLGVQTRIGDMSRNDGFWAEALTTAVSQSTADAEEGLRAFLEKRPPDFRGK